jgi:hypothetical protein
MQDFLVKIIDAVPQIRTKLQYGIAVLAILAFIFVQASATTPVLPQIFIFAVVPLLIAMQFIRPLSKQQQFIITLIITLMSLASLATGVAIAGLDKTPEFQDKYDHQVYPIEQKLNTRYLVNLETEIRGVENYGKYRELILRTAQDDSTPELAQGLERIVNFYEDYLDCTRKIRCWPSSQFDTRIRDVWYSYRQIIEERRVGLWGPEFAKMLQARAEVIRLPKYLSAIRRDPETGQTVLISTQPQR